MSEENQVVEEVAAAPAPSLGVGDLAYMVKIIDVCSKRGAFEGNEMESVGALRGKIAAFVDANAPKKEEEEPAAEEEATDE